jgi:hypothetical protein
MAVMHLDDLKMWLKACEKQATLFWHVISMTMKNLAIVQTQLKEIKFHSKTSTPKFQI